MVASGILGANQENGLLFSGTNCKSSATRPIPFSSPIFHLLNLARLLSHLLFGDCPLLFFISSYRRRRRSTCLCPSVSGLVIKDCSFLFYACGWAAWGCSQYQLRVVDSWLVSCCSSSCPQSRLCGTSQRGCQLADAPWSSVASA